MLQIYDIAPQFSAALKASNRLLISAPTGSGKSTQIPQMVVDSEGWGAKEVLVLQPRRLAARMLARRVANERQGRVGDEVGYQIRFDNRVGPSTRIAFVTEGVLLRRLVSDPELDGVGAVLLDEFHERHLYTDLALARLMFLQKTRPDLLLGVMSATLDVASLAEYLEPCARLDLSGRSYPLEIHYLPPLLARKALPVWENAAIMLERAVEAGAEGDALVFMPGRYEIQRTIEFCKRSKALKGFEVLPLHGELPIEQQDRAVSAGGGRKVVVATNVAETSLTIPGVRIVVDCGLARIPSFDSHRNINALSLENISQASAQQRAGRAGRVAPGEVFRLWTEKEQARRPAFDTPEIHRVDLSETLVMLAAGGVRDPNDLPWFDPPKGEAMAKAVERLRDLGAMEAEGYELTSLGVSLSVFPAHPRYGRMLLAAGERGCIREVALLAAILQGPPLLTRSRGKAARPYLKSGGRYESDVDVLSEAFYYAQDARFDLDVCRSAGLHAQNARQIDRLYKQFLDMAKRMRISLNEEAGDSGEIRKCLLLGFSDQVGVRRDGGTKRCRLVHGRHAEIDRHAEVVPDHLFVALGMDEIQRRNKEREVLLSTVSCIEEGWLQELFPQDWHEQQEVVYDEQQRRVVGAEVTLFRDLELRRVLKGDPPLDQAAELLAEGIMRGALVMKSWNTAADVWVRRIHLLAEEVKELEVAVFSEEDRRAVWEQVCYGATRYKEVKARDVWRVLSSWYGPEVNAALDHYFPMQVGLSNGRRAKVSYEEGVPPIIRMKVQDLYDVRGSVTVGDGRVVCRIEVLGPNYRPVHVTDNLSAFWDEVYPMVKKDLKGRYPKHEWRSC